VFLSTEAAKFWVTPTKLVPSTSTIRSFTWILEEVVRRDVQHSQVMAPLWTYHRFDTEAHTTHTPFRNPQSWQRDPSAVARNRRDKWGTEASILGSTAKTTHLSLTHGSKRDKKAFSVLMCLCQKNNQDNPIYHELTYLVSLCAAPPSVTVLTKMPNFSRPMSAPAPIPMILMPRPSPSEGEWGNSCYRAVTVM